MCVCRLKEIELYVLRFEVFVTVECIEVILSDHLCQCGMYRDIILLQFHIAVRSEHFVWWCAAYIACASLQFSVWFVVLQLLVGFDLPYVMGKGLPTCLTCVLLAC